MRPAAIVVAVVVLAACSGAQRGVGATAATTPAPATTVTIAVPTTSTSTTTIATTSTTTAPGTTVAPGGVPADMLNPAVSPATIATTICMSGYTTTIRPPTSYTEPLKVHQIATYGYTDHLVSDYEEDHVIALEIGGAPAAAVNLFPEPHTASSGDDTLENRLHSQVCLGAISLAGAQLQLFTAKLAHGYSRAKSTA